MGQKRVLCTMRKYTSSSHTPAIALLDHKTDVRLPGWVQLRQIAHMFDVWKLDLALNKLPLGTVWKLETGNWFSLLLLG